MIKPGDKSKGICYTCKKMVITTFKYGPLKEEIPNILIAYCDVCGDPVGIPHQSVEDIKRYRENNNDNNV